jgi:hypothetical protein
MLAHRRVFACFAVLAAPLVGAPAAARTPTVRAWLT